jgi:hypothetical protein
MNPPVLRGMRFLGASACRCAIVCCLLVVLAGCSEVRATVPLDPAALERMALLIGHVFFFATAAGAIAFGDYAIFYRPRIDLRLLGRATSVVMLALGGLWLTGLGLIWLDTGFHIAEIASRPKLLAKLTVVSALTLNGLALHGAALPRLSMFHGDPRRAATLPAVLGAVSATTWIYAACIGLGAPVAAVLGYRGFMLLYILALSIAIAVSLGVVRPRLARQMRRSSYAMRARAESAVPRRDSQGAPASRSRDFANLGT